MKSYWIEIRKDFNTFDIEDKEVKAKDLFDLRVKLFPIIYKRKADGVMVLKNADVYYGGMTLQHGYVEWANAERPTPRNCYVSPLTGRLVSKETYVRDLEVYKRRK